MKEKLKLASIALPIAIALVSLMHMIRDQFELNSVLTYSFFCTISLYLAKFFNDRSHGKSAQFFLLIVRNDQEETDKYVRDCISLALGLTYFAGTLFFPVIYEIAK
jgi:hypothetical protein